MRQLQQPDTKTAPCCGEFIYMGMGKKEEIRAEKEKLEKLRKLVDRTAFLLANVPMTDRARDGLLIATRREAEKIIPDQMETYTLIYESRFYRLIEQFGGRHNLAE
jgi:hypothetical protein